MQQKLSCSAGERATRKRELASHIVSMLEAIASAAAPRFFTPVGMDSAQFGSLGESLHRTMSRVVTASSPARSPGASSTFAIPTYAASSGALDGETEVARVQKQNFNLKLRIYYLEEVSVRKELC